MAANGDVIDGKYEILRLIGEGGMSNVYLAMDKRLHRQWAVKEVVKSVRDMNNAIVRQSAIAEANLLKELDHPALPRIVDIIDNGDIIYVVMDYVEGDSVSDILKEQGVIPDEVVADWALDLCEVLDYLHTRQPPVIHRDIKPKNIILTPEGNIKLLDFGIARRYDEKKTADTVGLGTRGYAAPEQFGGQMQTDARTDIFGLGTTMRHMLTGVDPETRPYPDITAVLQDNPNVDSGLAKVVEKCIRLNPEDRYQSCVELIYDLENYHNITDNIIAEKRGILHRYIVLCVVMLAAVFVGFLGMFLRGYSNDAHYQRLLTEAQKASGEKERLDLYTQAVDIKPTDMEAYTAMIETMKEDAVFSVEEEKIFINAITPHLTQLKKEEDYPALAFEAGKAYWYYYNYGEENSTDNDNRLTRMKSSIQWFEDVVTLGEETETYFPMAKVYRDVGKFNRDITLNLEEASDKDMYKEYWSNITELVNTIGKDEENELVRLEVFHLAANALEKYAGNFRRDGIIESEMRTLHDSVWSRTSRIETTSEKTGKLKSYILSRFDDAETHNDYVGEAISNAFEEL